MRLKKINVNLTEAKSTEQKCQQNKASKILTVSTSALTLFAFKWTLWKDKFCMAAWT